MISYVSTTTGRAVHTLTRMGAALLLSCAMSSAAFAQGALDLSQGTQQKALQEDLNGDTLQGALELRIFPIGAELFCPEFDEMLVRYAVYVNEWHTSLRRVVALTRAAYPGGIVPFDAFNQELEAERSQLKAENYDLSLGEFANTLYLYGVLVCEIAPDEYVRRVAQSLIDTGSFTDEEALIFVNSYRRYTIDFGIYRQR